MDDQRAKGGEGFVARWSRRKTEVKEKLEDQGIEELKEEKFSSLGEISPPESVDDEIESNDDEKKIIEELPDVETLDEKSDYTPFLKDGVPEKLKKMALRKLWTSNPAFSFLDGLDDYDDDFSAIGIVAQEVFTNYKPGKGFVDPEEPEEEKEDSLEASNSNEQKEEIEESSEPEAKNVMGEEKDEIIENSPSTLHDTQVSEDDSLKEKEREKLEASSEENKT